ncbi:hypothetical protein [Emticicia aquatilis]|nr:hypothetical protein [Emticicia aquatilis]
MKSSKLSLNKQTVFKFQSKNSKGHNRSCPTVTTSMLTVLKNQY